MNEEPKIVIVGRGQDPSGYIGRTEAEHDALFAAIASGDKAALEAAIGVAPQPTKLDVAGIYRRANAARAPRPSQAPRASAAAPAATFDPDAIYRRVNAAKAPPSGGRGR